MGEICHHNMSLFLFGLWECFGGGFQTKNGAMTFGLGNVC